MSGLWRYDTGQVYSIAVAGVAATTQQKAILTAAGYPDAPGSSTVYYGERGSQTFPGYGLVDLDLNYNMPVFGSVSPWVKFDVFNLLNNQKLITVQHDLPAGSEHAARCARVAHRRDPGTAVRPGDGADELPGAVRRRDGRPHFPRRCGSEVLTEKIGQIAV